MEPREGERGTTAGALKRRRWLIATTAAIAVAAVGLVLLRETGAMRLPVPTRGEVAADFVDGQPVFVVHDMDGTVRVLDAMSPHDPFEKVLAWCRTSGAFEDLWHGSIFDRQGDWLGGPAPTGMAPYEVLERSDKSVAVGSRAEPPARPAERERADYNYTGRTGPRCDERTALYGDDVPVDRSVLDDLVIHEPSEGSIDGGWYPTPERITGQAPTSPG